MRSVGSSRPDLADHQRSGVEWIRQVRRGLLADEPGLGKSRTAIEAFDGGRVLVVAPNLILSSGTWDEELAKWSDHPDRYTLAPYSMLNARQWTGAKRADGTANLSATAPVEVLRDEFKRTWDALIVDEAHYTKGRKTCWTWATQEIAKHSGAVLEMTGTPMPNWAHELFTILQVLYPEDAKRGRRLGSYWRWVGEWFEIVNPTDRLAPERRNPRAKAAGDMKACYPECLDRPATDPCEHYQRFVRDNLGERFLRRWRDDVLDLPPVTESVIEVPMDDKQKRHYRELKNDLVTTVGDTELVAWSQGSKNVLLDRATTSDWCLDPQGPPVGGKFERLRFDLESRTRPTLVLAHYQLTVEACAAVAASTGARVGYVHGNVPDKQAGQVIRDFKAGKLDVLVGSLETVSEGLTLVVADMAIFVEKSYKPSRNEQAMRRIHRMGQTRPVTILDYVTPHSVDAGKRLLLATKTDRQMRVLRAAELLAVA